MPGPDGTANMSRTGGRCRLVKREPQLRCACFEPAFPGVHLCLPLLGGLLPLVGDDLPHVRQLVTPVGDEFPLVSGP